MANQVAYFGYGSLVNELTWTRKYEMITAEIHNWIREWKHCVDTPWGRVCALTVSREAKSAVQGAFILCDLAELKEVDEREIGYERVELSRDDVVSPALTLPDRLFVYRSTPPAFRSGDAMYPLWMSYIEVVLVGYWRVFGETGIDHFINSTRGWDTPILDDRAQPLYPRFVQLQADDRNFIEQKLRSAGLRFDFSGAQNGMPGKRSRKQTKGSGI
jgi:glutathione-specific gamma-glutamylcyclotransferase